MQQFSFVDGYALMYDVAGDGPPVVLVHDGLLDADVWAAQVEALAPTHRVVTYNRRGYGASPLPTAPYSNVEDLRLLFDHLGIERAAVVGASNGGGVALDFTVAYPERVERLMLVGATLTGFALSPAFHDRTMHMFQPLIEDRDVEASIERFANDPYLVAGDNEPARDRVRQLLQAHWNSMINPQDLIMPPPAPSAVALATLTQPTLVLIGEHDQFDVHAHAGAIAFGIPSAERVVVPGAGHYIYIEQPDTFNTHLLQFLA